MRETYECTAGELATQPVDAAEHDWTVASTRTWLAENGYDVAPVVKNDTPIGYIERESLDGFDLAALLEGVCSAITLEEIITANAGFDEIVEALSTAPFYFLGGRNEVAGILTRADLNTPPAYMHLYNRISVLEQRLRDLIVEEAPDWDEQVALDPEIIDDVKERHTEAERANIALNQIHYAQFSTLVTVVSSSEACWEACGFTSGHQASSRLDDVRSLRNAVAHSNRIIENTSQGLLEEGRTIGNLEAMYSTIQSCLNSLTTDPREN